GASAYARWLHTPTTSTSPSAWALPAASASAGHSATAAPPRPSPVSSFRWSRAGRPARRPAATISCNWCTLAAERSTPALTPSCSGSPGASSQASTGAVIPARRRVSASSRVQTPSAVAPASTAARATGTMPCPYPSALTTAISSAVGAAARSRVTLCRIASRSTRTSACHITPPYFPPPIMEGLPGSAKVRYAGVRVRRHERRRAELTGHVHGRDRTPRGGPPAGESVQVRGGDRGPLRGETGREQGPEQPGQHVSGPAGGQRRGPGRVRPRLPGRGRHASPVPFEQDRPVHLGGQPQRRLYPVRAGLLP